MKTFGRTLKTTRQKVLKNYKAKLTSFDSYLDMCGRSARRTNTVNYVRVCVHVLTLLDYNSKAYYVYVLNQPFRFRSSSTMYECTAVASLDPAVNILISR